MTFNVGKCRLSAILISGYSRLMGDDEHATASPSSNQ